MRKSHLAAANALLAGEYGKHGNGTTWPCIIAGRVVGTELTLHGNVIAVLYDPGQWLLVRDAGWQSATTKAWINSILSEVGQVAPGTGIRQVKGQWLLVNGEGLTRPWTGSTVVFKGGL
jgi:hypothetical protein